MTPNRNRLAAALDQQPVDPVFSTLLGAVEDAAVLRLVLDLERRGEITAAAAIELIRAVARLDGNLLSLLLVDLPPVYRARAMEAVRRRRPSSN